jgi:drug/metabolite transporter (DMT)-like permease
MQVASLRSGIAALALILWLRGGARWSWRVLPVAVVYAATLVLFVTSTKLTTAASAIFLQSTAPLFIIVLAPILLRERFDRRDLLFISAAAAGLALCFAGQPAATATAPDPFTGNLLGAASSVTWAFTLLGLRWGDQHAPGTALAAVIAGNVLAFASGIPALLPFPAAPPAEWFTLAYLGVFQIGLAYILLTSAVGHLPTLHISLLLLLEPVLNPIWTWLVHGENPGGWTLAGGAIVIAASAAQATFRQRHSGPGN